MRAFLCGAALLLTASVGGAAAQTAEEAVAYAFLGLADGASLERSGTTMEWVETAASPATFDGEAVIGGHRSKLRFVVTAVEDCRFEITLHGPETLVPGGSRLFGRVALGDIDDVSIGADGLKSHVEGNGFCETGQRNSNCMVMHDPDFFGTVDPERHRAAVVYLRGEACVATN